MLKRLRDFIDFMIPAEDKAVATELRKGRFFIVMLLLIEFICLTNVIFFLSIPEPNILATTGTLIVMAIVVSEILIYRKIGRRALFTNILNAFSYPLISFLVFNESGGIYSSDLVFFIGASSWTFLIAGKRSGLFWFLYSFVFVLFCYGYEMLHPGGFLVAFHKLGPDYALMNYGFGIWMMFAVIAINQKNSESYIGEIKEKQAEIEQKNKEITDSINYARRLQEAILPPMQHVKEIFNDYFVFYQPKDIVAGDFYWMERRDHHVFFAVADCTGHGVPGAMVSVVCSNALNHAVREFRLTEPGEILDKVSELVQDTFAKSGSDVNDGMDLALIAVNTSVREVKYAGANNHLWYIQNDKLHEIRADKQPVGRFEYRKHFTTHVVKINSGDAVYLFTDGYADQFGGPKGKKFKYKQLQKTLLANHSMSMDRQEQELEQAFHQWKGNLEQVDDVCVVGIRFN